MKMVMHSHTGHQVYRVMKVLRLDIQVPEYLFYITGKKYTNIFWFSTGNFVPPHKISPNIFLFTFPINKLDSQWSSVKKTIEIGHLEDNFLLTFLNLWDMNTQVRTIIIKFVFNWFKWDKVCKNYFTRFILSSSFSCFEVNFHFYSGV